MTRVDPATLAPADARAMLDASLAQWDNARLAAGMARGPTKRRYSAIAQAHGRNAMALADALYGAPSASVDAMSYDDLFAELAGSDAQVTQ